MSLGDIVDELHDKHGLAHAGAAEEADLTAFAVGLEKVDDLDAGVENLGSDRQVVELGRGLMDRAQILAVEGRKTVDGVAHDIEQASFDLIARRDSDRMAYVDNRKAALEAVGALHSNAANGVFADMLLDLECQFLAVGIAGAFNFQGGVDRR